MTVYVVQQQHRLDRDTGSLVPKYPALEEKAAEHGPVRYLLSPSAAPWASSSIVRDLERELAAFSDEDCLLLVGNPILIGLATAVAAHANGGRVRMLQWSGKENRYLSVDAQLTADAPRRETA